MRSDPLYKSARLGMVNYEDSGALLDESQLSVLSKYRTKNLQPR